MKTRFLILAVILSSIFCTVSVSAQSDAPQGFESLFNGKDLTGWFAMKTADPRKFASLSQEEQDATIAQLENCLLYTSPSPRDKRQSRMPSSA